MYNGVLSHDIHFVFKRDVQDLINIINLYAVFFSVVDSRSPFQKAARGAVKVIVRKGFPGSLSLSNLLLYPDATLSR